MQNPFHQSFQPSPSSASVSDCRANYTVTLADSAARQIKLIQQKQNNPNLMLRIAIAGGGCSGMQYKFSLDDRQTEHDQIFANNDAKIICDRISLPYLNNATIEYKETLAGSAFQIQNPNAESACGCGVSFSPTNRNMAKT